MSTILICRSCGSRASADLAVNQQELANVGMLELRCHHCGAATRWGLAQDYRAGERRRVDRRSAQRRTGRGLLEGDSERRAGYERRRGPIRHAERRAAH
jgi:hypothetical protein